MKITTRIVGAFRESGGALFVSSFVFLGSLAAHAAPITINFETLPALPTQPNNFFAAGAMQTYTAAGVFSISGGVALGNPTFLAAFPAHGSPPNLYGTADFADPSLLDTITLTMPSGEGITGISGVLFNGQPIAETYTVSYFSGITPLGVTTFLNMGPDSNAATGFGTFSLMSTLANPITRVAFTTPNGNLNGWDFFVDTIVLTQTQVPEPPTLLLLTLALAGAVGMRRTRARQR